MPDDNEPKETAAPSIFHQGSKMILANLAGFAMQKLIENAYDQFLTNRKNKAG